MIVYIYIIIVIISFVLSIVAIVLKTKKCPDNSCVCNSKPIITDISPGTVIMWSQNDIPTGWVVCDGTNGTPDLRGNFILGQNDGKANTYGNVASVITEEGADEILSIRNMKDTGGETAHVLSIDEMANHTHTISHILPSGYTVGYEGGGNNFTDSRNQPMAEPTGGNQAHNNMPPYYVLVYIMKT